MREKPDFMSTTAVIAYVRRKVTPTMLWSASGILLGALVACITGIVTMQADMRQVKEHDVESKKEMADMRGKLDLLQEIRTQLAVMNGKVDGIADEVDRQREWRERIEGIAESPPHARKRR